MASRVQGWSLFLVWGALGCGQTSDNSHSVATGAAGATNGNAAAGSAGETAPAGAANSGAPGAAGATSGTSGGSGGAANSGGGSGGTAGAACTAVAHTRPTPGALSRSFADIAGDVAGVYLIDDLFDQAQDCSMMCDQGNAFGKPYPYRYVAVRARSGDSSEYDINGCEQPAACADDSAVHLAVGVVDTAKSDQILSAGRSSVESPQGQTCSGASVNTWLIQTAPNQIRVDVQKVNVSFAAAYDSATGLWGCDSGAVDSAAAGQACNALTVIDATRAQ